MPQEKLQKTQAQVIRDNAYLDCLRYREIAQRTGDRNDSKTSIYYARIWIRATIIDMIQTKQLTHQIVEDQKQLTLPIS